MIRALLRGFSAWPTAKDITTNGQNLQPPGPAVTVTIDEAAASIIQSIGKQTIRITETATSTGGCSLFAGAIAISSLPGVSVCIRSACGVCQWTEF